MNMQLVGAPQPITKLALHRRVDLWIIYSVDGEVKLYEEDLVLEEVRRHMKVGDLLIAWQDGKPFVGTLHMTTTLSPLTVSI